jgi:hypothetical protein
MADNEPTTVSRRIDELRARRAARAAERAAFAECRTHGLSVRHAAKLAWLAGREEVLLDSADVVGADTEVA